MTDRELVEAAARAADIAGVWDERLTGYGIARPDCIGPVWNPLTRDADALRLMARLNINVSYRENINGAWVVAEREGIDFCPETLDGPHEYDATRRAITRAAAAIATGVPPSGGTHG